MQFRITDNFTLANFSGGIVSIKRQYSPGSAVRLGVGGFLNDAEESGTLDDPDTTIARQADRKSQGFSLELQYVGYLAPKGRVSPFWALGPTFSYLNSDGTRLLDGMSSQYERNQWSVGALANLGVEWFPTRIIGLHAEYGLSVGYFSDDYEQAVTVDPVRVDTREISGWSLRGESVLFGLSVYF